MNLAKLRSVVLVSKHGSFRAAAKSMAITQSAVSKAVAEVESDLGFAVFERHARGVVLTAAGQDFVDRAARIFADLDLLVESAAQKRLEDARVLRYGVAPPSLVGLLNRPVRQLVLDDPALRLQCHAVGMPDGIEQLRRGDIDVLVGPTAFVQGLPELAMRVIQPRFRPCLCVRRGHPLAGRLGLKPADVATFPFIHSTAGHLYEDHFFDAMAESWPRVAHVLDNVSLVVSILERSDALAVFSEGYATSSAVKEQLEILDVPLTPLVIGCIYRRRWLATAAMRDFMDALEAHPPA